MTVELHEMGESVVEYHGERDAGTRCRVVALQMFCRVQYRMCTEQRASIRTGSPRTILPTSQTPNPERWIASRFINPDPARRGRHPRVDQAQ